MLSGDQGKKREVVGVTGQPNGWDNNMFGLDVVNDAVCLVVEYLVE